MPDAGLPEPPKRVYATVDSGKPWAFAAWWFYRSNVKRFRLLSGTYKRITPERLEVIPHPENDAEAVALIEGAKEK